MRVKKVKNIVNKLKQNKRKEAKENVTMYRSWGKYTLLTESEGYRVRKIEMDPGGFAYYADALSS